MNPHKPDSRARRSLLFRRRDFGLLWLGETTSVTGSAMTSVVLPLIAVTVLDAGTFVIALVEAAIWLPWLVVGLPAGALIDRLRSRGVMVWCDVVGALTIVLLVVSMALDALTVGQLLAAALVSGVRAVFFEPAHYKYLPLLVEDDELPAANSLVHGSESASVVAGPALAGVVVGAFGALAALLADAVTFLVSALCLLGIRTREPRPERTAGPGGIGGEIAEGVRFTVRDRYLRVVALTGGLLNFTLAGMGALQVVFLVRTNGVPAALAGVVVGLAGLGGVVGAVVATFIARRLGSARAVVAIIGTGVVCGLLVPLTGPGPALGWFVVGTLGQVATVVAANVLMAGFTQRYCPRELLARVMVVSRVVAYATAPLGAVAAGALGSALGVRGAMWVLALSAASAVAVQVLGGLARTRDLPATYDPSRT